MKQILLFFMLSIMCLNLCTQINERNGEPIINPDKMPYFSGDSSELDEFINDRMFYPWAGDSIKGRVIVGFEVSKFGDLEKIKVLRGLNPLADSIAVSIINEMPRWVPAVLNGIPMSTNYTLPILFDPDRIDEDKKLSKNTSMPSYPGGEGEMYKFICENLKYPNSAIEASIQGKIPVQLIIDSKGRICYPQVIRSLDPNFDAEALRIVRMMPDWIVPEGNKGCYLYTFPIIFKLQ